MITAICVTYGRQKLLERAIWAFIHQQRPLVEDFELLILNTLPRQKLVFDDDETWSHIINLPERPRSLGTARNMAVEAAHGSRIIIWDDDDVMLPNLISTFADNWKSGDEWVWLDKRLCAHGDAITEIGQGCHGGCFGFTKKAWKEVGGYPNLTVGEDRVLVQKITKLPGRRVHLGDMTPPFICCWGNGAWHVSGGGDDKPDLPSAHVRAEAALNRRLATGEERTGTIVLKPKCDVDWPALAQAFMAGELKKNSMSDVCVVELGRYGDIVNILPILLHIHNEFGTPTLMVSRQFADILDGVSYVKPHVVELTNDQLEPALKIARKEYKHVLCAQIWGGPNYHQEKQTASFNMESWRQCGFLHKFSDPTWRPVFDRRDREREAAIVAKLTVPGKPMLLVNVTHSVSSPFPAGPLLLTAIQEALGKEFNIVNVGGMKLHRIYDLLGLMDAAACLVSVDSAHLHLAAASDVPTVALVNDQAWQGSVMRGNCIARYHYQCAFVHPEDIIVSVRAGARMQHPRFLPGVFATRKVISERTVRRLFHCTEMHVERNHREATRKAEAQRSWKAIYDQGVVPCHLTEDVYPRTALSIGDRRALPYLKDVLHLALCLADPDDIIFWTNDDNVLHSQLPEMLRYHVALFECCSSQRCEFKGPMPPLSRPPNDFSQAGNPHMGRDLFAFTKRWLETHWDGIPDFILGASDFDLCLAAMVRLHFGIKTSRRNLEDVIFPAEMPRGYISHSYHPPKWADPRNENYAPSQIHNRTAFVAWAKEHAPHLKFDENMCL